MARPEMVEQQVLRTGNVVQDAAYAKVGFARWDVDRTDRAGGVAVRASSGTNFTFGLGLKYAFTKNISARLEYQRYNNIGNGATTGQSDVDRFSLGAVFKF